MNGLQVCLCAWSVPVTRCSSCSHLICCFYPPWFMPRGPPAQDVWIKMIRPCFCQRNWFCGNTGKCCPVPHVNLCKEHLTCVTSSPRYQWKLCQVSLLQACYFFLSINLFWPMLPRCCCLFKETWHCFFIENVPLTCRCHGWKHCNCRKGDLTCKYVRI